MRYTPATTSSRVRASAGTEQCGRLQGLACYFTAGQALRFSLLGCTESILRPLPSPSASHPHPPGFRFPGEYQAPALGRVRRPGSDVIEEVPASREEAEVAAYLEGLEQEEAEA